MNLEKRKKNLGLFIKMQDMLLDRLRQKITDFRTQFVKNKNEIEETSHHINSEIEFLYKRLGYLPSHDHYVERQKGHIKDLQARNERIDRLCEELEQTMKEVYFDQKKYDMLRDKITAILKEEDNRKESIEIDNINNQRYNYNRIQKP